MPEVQLNDHEQYAFNRSASAVRIQGILSIIFGGLGLLMGLLFGLVVLLSGAEEPNSTAGIGVATIAVLGFIFFVLPHIFMIVAGTYFLRKPAPSLSRTLTIINLIIGFFWNLPVLIVAIIVLVMSGDYDRYYARNSTTV